MKIPPGYTEATVLEAIEKAVNILAPSFVFGYLDLDDIKQIGRVFAMELLEKETFDASRPLANYIYRHLRNRYINLRRDKLRRNDPPCARCHSGNPCGPDGETCARYAGWLARNNAKANLMRPLDIQHISDEREKRTRSESTVSDDVERAELLEKIDRALPVELRSSYLQMRDGVALPRAKRQLVLDAIHKILGDEVSCRQNEDDSARTNTSTS